MSKVQADMHVCERILATSIQYCLLEQAIGALASAPGASNTVLDASVPYAASATMDLLGGLGHEPASLCSIETVGKLAKRAYVRAAELSAPGHIIIGLACTASLRTVRAQNCVWNLPNNQASVFCLVSRQRNSTKPEFKGC